MLSRVASQLKIGSNDENLRKLEPQQKQRVLIKKKVYIYMNLGLIYLYESWPHTKPGNLQKVFGRWVGGGGGGFTVSLVFCFGPKIWFRN